MQTFPLVLDTLQSGVQQTVTGFYCGDAEEKQLCITLLHQNVPYTPQPGTLALCGNKPDGTVFLHPCTVSGSQVYYMPTAQTLAVPGTVTCQLIAYGENGSVLYAPQFAMQVDEPLTAQNSVVSADEWTLLPVHVLSNLSLSESGSLLLENEAVGALILADTYADLLPDCTGKMAYVRYADTVHPFGFYVFDTQWTYLPVSDMLHTHTNKNVLDTVTAAVVNDAHTHANKTVLDLLEASCGHLYYNEALVGGVLTVSQISDIPIGKPEGVLAYATSEQALYRKGTNGWYKILDGAKEHTHANKVALDTVTAAVVSNAHTHANKAVLDQFDASNGVPMFGEDTLVTGDALNEALAGVTGGPAESAAPDTLVPLALDTVYPSMSVRADWYDVPAYALGEYAAVAQLSSDTTVGGYAESKIMLSYPPDYSTGMPCPMLTVHTGGDLFACFPTLYHDLGAERQAGWYAGSGMEYLGQTAPTLSDMSFDRLVIFEDNGDTTRTEYTDLTDLPAKARSALDMLSRMVNVSTSTMGTLGVVENGVQRLTHAPQFGRHYVFTTDSDFELPFPSTAWTPDDASFTLDLYCTSDVAMTLPRDRLMDNGKQPDTSAGYHRLTFRYNHNADKISVGEVTQVVPQYWDDIPDEVTTLEDCTWSQIKSIATHGYVNRQGQWCIRRNDQEEVWFEIGDEKIIELSTGETWTLQIWDFMHDDLADGSGKSSITFGMKGLTSDTYKMNTTDTISGGWEQCYFRTQTLPTILNTLPQALRSVIVSVSKVSSAGDATTLVTTSDALFLPSSKEYGAVDKPYGEGEKYTIFINSALGLSYNYWTRTSYSEDRPNKWRYIGSDGRTDSYMATTATTMYRVRFAFCI